MSLAASEKIGDIFALPTCVFYDNHQATETLSVLKDSLAALKSIGYQTLCIELTVDGCSPRELATANRQFAVAALREYQQVKSRHQHGLTKLNTPQLVSLESQKRQAENARALAELIEHAVDLGLNIVSVDIDPKRLFRDYQIEALPLPEKHAIICGECDSDLSRRIFAARKTENARKIIAAQQLDQNGVLVLLGLRHMIHAELAAQFDDDSLEHNVRYFNFFSTQKMVAAETLNARFGLPSAYAGVSQALHQARSSQILLSTMEQANTAEGPDVSVIMGDLDDAVEPLQTVLAVILARQKTVGAAEFDIDALIDERNGLNSCLPCCSVQ